MLAKIEDEYGIHVDTSFLMQRMRKRAWVLIRYALLDPSRRRSGFSAAPKCVLGNFDYQKMAMVEDLRNNEQMLSENELVSAIAGDEERARQLLNPTQYLDD